MEIDVERNQLASALLGIIILAIIAVAMDASLMQAIPLALYGMMLAGVIGGSVLFYILLKRTYQKDQDIK